MGVFESFKKEHFGLQNICAAVASRAHAVARRHGGHHGHMGACATVVIPWFADQYAEGRDWRDLAWWLHSHLDYHEIWFFPKLAAFNLTWREEPERRIAGYMPHIRMLKRPGEDPAEPGEPVGADFPFAETVFPKLGGACRKFAGSDTKFSSSSK